MLVRPTGDDLDRYRSRSLLTVFVANGVRKRIRSHKVRRWRITESAIEAINRDRSASDRGTNVVDHQLRAVAYLNNGAAEGDVISENGLSRGIQQDVAMRTIAGR